MLWPRRCEWRCGIVAQEGATATDSRPALVVFGQNAAVNREFTTKVDDFNTATVTKQLHSVHRDNNDAELDNIYLQTVEPSSSTHSCFTLHRPLLCDKVFPPSDTDDSVDLFYTDYAALESTTTYAC
eukprot:Plantae.Rhodophyta-Purpureofilum_apyrenoidigerum.ctg13390.p1 GENE.Plantae.Rhodophyta-Purpureofilum_apyrenoidigerum.ctg13390~~Plantae.Rhodophyta-Purpureofilum_apyrenoidigerum.ctg13390.p1  ORF type:complete len:127 (-),score=10.19 Plantae.Rhodophyta-Purpureofilum_apyrenoidigerum.ctg13390:582-962(-)